MGLNVVKGQMYNFIDYTWNTVKGRCPHDCSYCYMKRFPQKDVRFDEKELKTDLGSWNFIFVGSSCDMWAEAIPDEWIYETLEKCAEYENKYFYQTKNPRRFQVYERHFAGTDIICITLESNRYTPKITGFAPSPWQRVYDFKSIGCKRFITIEPILDFDHYDFIELVKTANPEQVNIGADSGRNNLPEPSADKVLALIDALSKFTKVVQKDNLKRILKEK